MRRKLRSLGLLRTGIFEGVAPLFRSMGRRHVSTCRSDGRGGETLDRLSEAQEGLVGYFQAYTGTINQLVHLWKFDDDADRRAHWAAVYSNEDFVEGFASKFPAAADDPGGEAASGRTLGSAPDRSPHRRLRPNSTLREEHGWPARYESVLDQPERTITCHANRTTKPFLAAGSRYF
jgi:hypothetical protein